MSKINKKDSKHGHIVVKRQTIKSKFENHTEKKADYLNMKNHTFRLATTD